MKECSKSIQRRLGDSNFIRRYFVGNGIDIGGKPDPLMLYKEFFPLMDSVKTWDREDGDAQYLDGIPDNSLDFVHSSHCLEHIENPSEGFVNWFRVIKEGGHMIVTVPDEDLYEQGVFPSTFNRDHKTSFTIHKRTSWNSCSRNVIDLILELGAAAEIIKIEQLTSNYRFDLPRYDQTITVVGECGIEIIIRKRPFSELQAGGRIRKSATQPMPEIRRHLNQYKDDLQSLKKINRTTAPFENDTEL